MALYIGVVEAATHVHPQSFSIHRLHPSTQTVPKDSAFWAFFTVVGDSGFSVSE